MATMTASAATTIPPHSQDSNTISFLDLPCELRLKVYHLVYLSSPVHHPKLAPWYAIPQTRTHIVRAVVAEEQNKAPNKDNTESTLASEPLLEQRKPVRLLSPHRPLCRIPSSLLQSCRQIYGEARTIPFHENEFVFLNWFASGLTSALAFTQGLVPWQREALRYLRLQLYGDNLLSDSPKFADWMKLCDYLTGVKGLRVTVSMHGDMSPDHVSNKVVMVRPKQIEDACELVGERSMWIEGVRKLGELSQLEVELADVVRTNTEKMEWCVKLQELLVASNKAAGVGVVCVVRSWGPVNGPK